MVATFGCRSGRPILPRDRTNLACVATYRVQMCFVVSLIARTATSRHGCCSRQGHPRRSGDNDAYSRTYVGSLARSYFEGVRGVCFDDRVDLPWRLLE